MSTKVGAGPKCTQHPSALAGWSCVGCSARLCPDCVAIKRMVSTELIICLRCQELAKPLTMRRSEKLPFFSVVWRAPLYPLNSAGLIAILAFALVMAVLSYGGGLATRIGVGIYWAYVFSIIRTSSRGSEEVEPFEFSSLFDDVLMPAFRGVVATTLIWLPAFVYAFSIRDWDSKTSPLSIALDPVVWVLVIAGVVYVPMALMIAATGGGVLRMINPLMVFGYIHRLGKDYWLALLPLGAVFMGGLLLEGIGFVVLLLPLPFVPRVIDQMLGAYAPFVMARVLGLLLYVRGDVLEYGPASDYEEPVLPGAVPRGALPSHVAAAGGDASAPSGRRRAPIELSSLDSPGPAQATPDPGAAAAEVSRLVAANQLQQAAALYGALAEPAAGALPAADHLAVGRRAAAEGNYPLAVKALKAAASSADPVAPNAMVILARLYGERMGQPAEAQQLYQAVLSRFPGTPAAKFAQERLNA